MVLLKYKSDHPTLCPKLSTQSISHSLTWLTRPRASPISSLAYSPAALSLSHTALLIPPWLAQHSWPAATSEFSHSHHKKNISTMQTSMWKYAQFHYFIKETWIQTVIQKHYTRPRMAKIKRTENTKCWQGYEAMRNLIHGWRQYNLLQPLWKTAQQLLLKLNIGIAYVL